MSELDVHGRHGFDLPPTLAVWLEAGRHPRELIGETGWSALRDRAVGFHDLTPETRAERARDLRAQSIEFAGGGWRHSDAPTFEGAVQAAVLSWWRSRW